MEKDKRKHKTLLKYKDLVLKKRHLSYRRFHVKQRLYKWFVLLGRFMAKEFMHIFRDIRTLFIVLGLPVVLIGVFGFALTTDVGEIKLLIVSPENNSFINKLSQELDASEHIKVLDILPPRNNYPDLFKKQQIDAILTLEKNFEQSILQNHTYQLELKIDGVDPNVASVGISNISGVIQDFLTSYAMEAGISFRSPIETHFTLLFNPELKASYYFVPGVMGFVLMIICALMTSVSIVKEKEYGSMDLLLTSPAHPGIIILSKALPYFILSILDMILILLLAAFVLKVPLSGSISALVFLTMLFILVSLLLGLLISSIAKTQLTAVIISGCGLLLPVSMISGIIFPLESIPHFLYYVAMINPATWFVDAAKQLMIQGGGWSDVQLAMYILSGMAALLVALSILSFKIKPQ